TSRGFAVDPLARGADALRRVEAGRPDAVVASVWLPDADGRDVCRAIRASGDATPVVLMGAYRTLGDRLSAFSAGGDDYLTKPVAHEELAARLVAILRRTGSAAVPRSGGLLFDPSEMHVSVDGTPLSLTPTEFRILAALHSRRDAGISRGDLRAAGWPPGAIVTDNTLDAYVARIRKKLGRVPGAPRIATMRGVGYALRADADTPGARVAA
ncbi:MAG: response regulator transcription factor, partial [Actinomycetota bacterium]